MQAIVVYTVISLCRRVGFIGEGNEVTIAVSPELIHPQVLSLACIASHTLTRVQPC